MKFSVLIKQRKKARLLFEVLYVLRVTTLKRKKFSGSEKMLPFCAGYLIVKKSVVFYNDAQIF